MKMTMVDGTQFEGTPEELVRLALLQQVGNGVDVTTQEESVDDPWGVSQPVVEAEVEPTPQQTPQQKRDAAVLAAKVFIDDVENIGLALHRRLTDIEPSYSGRWERKFFKFHFKVNKEKRAVTCIVRAVMGFSHEEDRNVERSIGVSKCAPDDVFNEFIGKAIALHRALGLTVPESLLNVPKPVGVQVGDIVRGRCSGRKANVDRVEGNKAFGLYETGSPLYSKLVDVIDDTKRYVSEM